MATILDILASVEYNEGELANEVYRTGGIIMGKLLGERISKMLQKRGIQQKELAEQIGITETAMSRYIAGTREPKPDVIANMATALQTTSDYLLGIENDAFNYHQVRRIIARNASSMTDQEKKALIDALFGEE